MGDEVKPDPIAAAISDPNNAVASIDVAKAYNNEDGTFDVHYDYGAFEDILTKSVYDIQQDIDFNNAMIADKNVSQVRKKECADLLIRLQKELDYVQSANVLPLKDKPK